MNLKVMTSTLIATAVFGASAFAAQPKVSTVQLVTPGNATAQPVIVSAGSAGTVRQRQAYGQGYRYGTYVSGPNGNIIIWSTAPNNNYGSAPSPGMVQIKPSTPVKYPGHSKPNYGKTTKPNYGD